MHRLKERHKGTIWNRQCKSLRHKLIAKKCKMSEETKWRLDDSKMSVDWRKYFPMSQSKNSDNSQMGTKTNPKLRTKAIKNFEVLNLKIYKTRETMYATCHNVTLTFTLRNYSETQINLKNWEISIVNSHKKALQSQTPHRLCSRRNSHCDLFVRRRDRSRRRLLPARLRLRDALARSRQHEWLPSDIFCISLGMCNLPLDRNGFLGGLLETENLELARFLQFDRCRRMQPVSSRRRTHGSRDRRYCNSRWLAARSLLASRPSSHSSHLRESR